MSPFPLRSRLRPDHVRLGIQALRFLAVGLMNTMFGYVIYLIALFFGLLPELALAVATAIGATFNYFTTSRLVFKHSKVDRFPRFIMAYSVIYLVNAGVLRGIIHLGLRPEWAQLILVPLIAILSFVIFRQFVFPKELRDVSKTD